MAFMMPVVKKNYTLYATSPNAVVDHKQRRTSDLVDANRNGLSSTSGSRRRKAKSEGQSLSTSPGTFMSADINTGKGNNKSQPVDMRRGRGSAPALVPVPLSVSYQQNQNMHKPARPSTSAPTGNSPIHGAQQSRSGSISSSSSSESTAPTGKFHSKLVMRLRKTFRIKDAETST